MKISCVSFLLFINSVMAFSNMTEENALTFYKVSSCFIIVSKEGYLVTGIDKEGTIQFLEIPTLKLLKTIKLHSKSSTYMVVSEDGTIAVSGGDRGDITIWETKSWTALKRFKRWYLDGNISCNLPNPFVLSKDKRLIALSGNDGYFRLKDIESGKTLFRTKVSSSIVGGSVEFASFLFEDKELLVIDDKIRLFDVTLKRYKQEIKSPKDGLITSATLSSDNKYLAVGMVTATATFSVYIYDTHTWQIINSFHINTDAPAIISLSFSPNGKYLAAGALSTDSKTPAVIAWDTMKGKVIKTIDKVGSNFWATFSLDSRYLIVRDTQGIGVWDVSKLLSDTTDTTKPQEGK